MEYVPGDGTLVPKSVGLNKVFIVCQVCFILILYKVIKPNSKRRQGIAAEETNRE